VKADAVMKEKTAIYGYAIKATGAYSGHAYIDFSSNPVAVLDCDITAWANKQKTDMSKSVYAFLAGMGCNISRAAVDAVDDRDLGAEIAEIGRGIRNDKRAEKILDAAKIADTEEAEIIEKGPDLAQSYQLERKRIEREYITDLSANDRELGKALVLTDNDGEVIAQIKRIEEGLATRESVLKTTRIFLEGANDFEDGKKHPTERAHALIIRAGVKRALFESAGLVTMPDGSIGVSEGSTLVEWDNRTLRKTKWFELCQRHTEIVNAAGLGSKLKPGWEKNPAKNFGEMLKACGLDTDSKRRELKSDPHLAYILKEKKGGVDHKSPRKFTRVYQLKKPSVPTSAVGRQRVLLFSTVNLRAKAGRNWVDVVWQDKQQDAEQGQEQGPELEAEPTLPPYIQEFADYNALAAEFGALATWGAAP
jgi:hypothetical protein